MGQTEISAISNINYISRPTGIVSHGRNLHQIAFSYHQSHSSRLSGDTFQTKLERESRQMLPCSMEGGHSNFSLDVNRYPSEES